MRKNRALLASLSVGVVAVMAPSTAYAAGHGGGGGTSAAVIYSSLAGTPLPANLPSVGAEAYAFSELGNQVTFAAGGRHLSNVVVTMSSWACVQGTWSHDDCVTPAGSTFSVPITLNIYDASTDGTHAGGLLGSVTQTFAIPYRPSASPQCTGDYLGEWYNSKTRTCYHGLVANITFDFSGQNLTLPDRAVYGIAYNTSHFGYSPLGESPACYSTEAGCAYDALNIALSDETQNLTVGTDTTPGTLWQNSPYGSEYCDRGTAGTNTFRLDSPSSACWAPYIPAVQFKAGA